MVFKLFGIRTRILLLLSVIALLNAEDTKSSADEARREADEFAKEYMEVIGHERNLSWVISKDFEAVPLKQYVKHGEFENCSGSITQKPICIICSHGINQTIFKVERTSQPRSATFLEGNLVFPHSDLEDKTIDVLLCTHSPKVAESDHFYLTRSKYAESAYVLNKVDDGGDTKNNTFTLSGKWISWYNEDLINHNFQVGLL